MLFVRKMCQMIIVTNMKWSFCSSVLGSVESQWGTIIILYSNISLIAETSDYIDTEKIAVFDHLVSFDVTSPENPREYPY